MNGGEAHNEGNYLAAATGGLGTDLLAGLDRLLVGLGLDLLGAHPLLDLLRHCQESLLNVGGILG